MIIFQESSQAVSKNQFPIFEQHPQLMLQKVIQLMTLAVMNSF